MHVRRAPIWPIFLILIAGCKKEKLDEQGPSIQILAPGNSSALHVPDTLDVTIHVSDDRIVEKVWITLGDVNGVPIAPSATVNVNGASATVQRSIIVTDPEITSGNYTLAVRASDGSNTSSAFRSVNVQEAALRLRAIFVTSPQGAITRIDSSGSVSDFISIGDLSLVEINSFTQQLFTAGGPFDPLDVLAVDQNAPTWQLQNQNAQAGAYFTALRTDRTDRRTYVSSNDGAIRGMDRYGIVQFNAQAIPGHRPYENVVVNDRFISEQLLVSTGEKRLVIYTYSSGDQLTYHSFDADALRMFAIDDQHMLLFGNRNGQGLIQQWNIGQGSHSDLRTFAEGETVAADAINTTTYVVALPGRVVRFDRSSNSVLELLSINAADVAFDKANNTVLVASGQDVLVVDPINGSIMNTISTSHQIARILPLFDR